MATLSQMSSSPSPSAYMPKLLGKVAVACVLSGALIHFSPAPAAPPQALVEVRLEEVEETGPGLMRREKAVPEAPPAPKPEAWGQLMRKEVPPVSSQAEVSSAAFFLVPCACVVLVGFATQGKGTLAHMASSGSPAAYLPKFLATVAVACILSGVMFVLSPSSGAQDQLVRSEVPRGPPIESQTGQSPGALVAFFAALAVVGFAAQGKGTLAQMASAGSPSALVHKFIAAVVVACSLAGALLHISPSPEGQAHMMRSETSLETQLGQGPSSRMFFVALFGLIALSGFAMQAKNQFMQLMSLGGFNGKAKK